MPEFLKEAQDECGYRDFMAKKKKSKVKKKDKKKGKKKIQKDVKKKR